MSDRQNIIQDLRNSPSLAPTDGEIRNGVSPGSNPNQSSFDKFSDELERRIQQQHTGSPNPFEKTFLHDYAQWKNHRVDSFFGSLVHLVILEPPNLELPDSATTPDGDSEAAHSKKTLSRALEELRTAIQRGSSKCVRVCTLTSTISNTKISRAFPERAKLLVTPSQLKRKYEAPLCAVKYVVDQEWNHSRTTTGDDHVSTRRNSSRLRRPPPTTLDTTFTLTHLEDIYLNLEWLGSAPHFQGSGFVYLWQPHIEPPISIKLRFSISGHTETEPRNILVVRESWDLSPSILSPGRHSMEEVLRAEEELRDVSSIWRSSANGETAGIQQVYSTICLGFLKLIQDTTLFIQSAEVELAELKYAGRRSPSNGKLHFLLHFDDCCHLCGAGLIHASKILEQISSSIIRDCPDILFPLKDWSEKYQKDIERLRKKLSEVEDESIKINQMVKSQVEIRNSRRTSLLGFLATIYIPFAFMSSLFGMNISQPIWGEIIPNAANYSDSASIATNMNNMTALSENDANAIINTISSSGTYLWSFEMYWAVAAPATLATILLPLVAGPTLRVLVTFSYENRTYARIIGTIVLIGGLTAADRCLRKDDRLYVFGIGFGVPTLAILCIYSWLGKEQWLWCSFSTIFAACIVVEWYFAPVTGLVNWVPFVFLSTVWGANYLITMPGPNTQRIRSFSERVLKSSEKFRKRHQAHWICHLTTLLIYYIFASTTHFFAPHIIGFLVFGIPLGVIGINRAIRSATEHKRRITWFVYVLIYAYGLELDIWIIHRRLPPAFQGEASIVENVFQGGPLFTYYIPMTWLFLCWLSGYYGRATTTFVRHSIQSHLRSLYRSPNANIEMEGV